MARKPVAVALVEVPAVDVEFSGASLLEDFTLNHPKYQQLLLIANLRQAADVDANVKFVDLKAGGERQRTHYGEIDYCGQQLDLWRVGTPFEHVDDELQTADVVGISANFTVERSMVVQTIDHLRTRRRPPLIVVGGHDATADPSFYLKRGADLCVMGEGETALQEIVRAVANDESPAVSGTITRADGFARRADRRRPNQYSELTFPGLELLRASQFDQSPDGPFPPNVSPRIMSLETSRGCPEACSFCDVSFIVGRHRPIPFEMLVERVQVLKAAGIRTIQVIDDNLLYRTLPSYEGQQGRQTILDLFRMLFEQGFAWEFFNGFQLALFERDGRVDAELIDTLYRSGRDGPHHVGCFRSYMPLDKVTPFEMSLLSKLKPLPVAEAVVSAIARSGVPSVVLGFVIGNIRETPQSLDETARCAEEFANLVVRSSGGRTVPAVLPLCSVPLPGTPDFRDFHDQIVFPPDRFPELYNIFVSVLRNDHFTPLELMQRRQRMRDALNRGVGPAADAAAAYRA